VEVVSMISITPDYREMKHKIIKSGRQEQLKETL
jgi:hypothetical protein